MASKASERGTVTFESRDGRSLQLRLSLTALCTIEELLGVQVTQIGEEITKSARALRVVLWAALQEHHKADFPTPEAAGTLIDMRDMEALGLGLAQALGVDPADSAALAAGGRPQPAQADGAGATPTASAAGKV